MRLLFILLLFLCACTAQDKPTLKDIDNNLKKSAAEQAVEARKAFDERTRASAAMKRVLDKQTQTALDAQHSQDIQEQRLEKIEGQLADVEKQRVDAINADSASRSALLAKGSEVFVGLIIAMVVWFAKGVYSLLVDGHRYRKIEENGQLADRKLNVIHGLVNSKMTEEMMKALGALVSDLASRLEVVSMKQERGDKVAQEDFDAIKTLRSQIAEQRVQLAERKQQSDDTADPSFNFGAPVPVVVEK